MPEKKETFDSLEIGLSQPAVRALHGAGIRRLEQLAGRREEEIARLHGMGPKGMAALRAALTLAGMSFAREDRASRGN
jgi:hypothetical protein